jgi:hypothetical protein
MRIPVDALSLLFAVPAEWRADWAWGLPLIILTVVIHVLSLGLVNQRGVRLLKHVTERHHPMLVFAQVMGTTTLLATSLHALEAALWAASYRYLGALPDFKSAMLYSLNAMTTYGHESLFLEAHWQLLGAIEALNGCLLFGLTTAFLFAMIQKVWLLDRGEPDIEVRESGCPEEARLLQ